MHRDCPTYLIPTKPCGRTPRADECIDGPKCPGCLGDGTRLDLDERTPVIVDGGLLARARAAVARGKVALLR